MTEKITLGNGIIAIVTENPVADIVAARLFFRTGSAWETYPQAGLTHLLASVLTKGTEQSDAYTIAERIESLGASFHADASPDYFVVALKGVGSDFATLLELAAEVVRSPIFPEEHVDLERQLALQQIKQSQEQPMGIAFDTLRSLIYQDHPYAFSQLGTVETMGNLQREDLQHFHASYFRPDNLVISIAGRIDTPTALEMVEKYFGDWIAPAIPIPEMVLPPLSVQPKHQDIPQNTQQAIVMLGYLTTSVHQPEYYPLKMISTYLGNGLSSRLFVELREKQGLAYEVSCLYPTRNHPAVLTTYLGTAVANQAKAQIGLKAEIDRLSQQPLSAEELQITKNKILGQYALGKQTNAQLAQSYGWYEVMGLGIEFDHQFLHQITQVTAADIQTVAQTHLQQPYTVVVGGSQSP